MKPENFEIFGSYLLLDRLAYGGMAEVFLARPALASANGRILIIKRILPHVANEPEFLSMFNSEIQVCMGFNNPNIVQIYDFGQIEGRPYIAMELVEGKNLRQLVSQFARRGQRVPIGVSVSIAAQTAAALHYAHTFKNRVTGDPLNVVHRDVSPQNILISYDGNVKLIDFGIAKAEVESADLTRSGSIKGKVSYLSPEQIAKEELDGRSDIFSLGAVLWELLTGQKLFTLMGRNDIEVMGLIKNSAQHVKPPSAFNPNVPEELDEIVLKALANRCEDRFQSASEFQKALRTLLVAHMPGYSYSDVAASVREAFREEQMEERMFIQTLNENAQHFLTSVESTRATIEVPAMPQVPKFSGMRSSSNPNLPVYPGGADAPPTGAMAGTSTSVTVPVERSGFYIKLTPGRMLAIALYIATIVFLRLDREYFFLERFASPVRSVRMASVDAAMGGELEGLNLTENQIALLRESHYLSRARAIRAKKAVARSVYLKVNLAAGSDRPAAMFLNEMPIDLTNPLVRVPLDQPLSLRIETADSRSFEKIMKISSAEVKGPNQLYSVDIAIPKAQRQPAAGKVR